MGLLRTPGHAPLFRNAIRPCVSAFKPEYLTFNEIAWIALAGFVASTMAALTGTGGGILLLPVLVVTLGVQDAIPAYTLAQFIGNLSRVGFNRSELRFEVVAWFIVGAVPAAALGALLFARTQEHVLIRALGLSLLATVAWRHLNPNKSIGFTVKRFAPIGADFGFISGYMGSAGPFLAPFFLAFGLARGANIGTEALGTAVMHITRMTAYGATNVFPYRAVLFGMALTPIMIAGSFAGKGLLDRISPSVFVLIIETILVVFGLLFLIRG